MPQNPYLPPDKQDADEIELEIDDNDYQPGLDDGEGPKTDDEND